MILIGVPLILAFAVSNALSRISVGKPPRGHVSSALIRITIASQQAREAHRFSANRMARMRGSRGNLSPELGFTARSELGVAPATDAILNGIAKVGQKK